MEISAGFFQRSAAAFFFFFFFCQALGYAYLSGQPVIWAGFTHRLGSSSSLHLLPFQNFPLHFLTALPAPAHFSDTSG